MKNKRSIIYVILIILFLLVSVIIIQKKDINIRSYGHGDYSRGGFKSLSQSLGIGEDYDVDLDGGMCLNEDCWSDADDSYDECCGYVDLMGFGIMLVGLDEFGDECSAECEVEYEDNLRSCQIPCEEEVYIWDGTPINNLDSFFSVNYPNFYEQSKNRCEGWLASGTWVENSNEIGCIDFRFYTDSTCSRNSVASAGVVCEGIGKTFTCNENKITCEDI